MIYIKQKEYSKNKIIHLSIAMFSLNLLTNGNYLLDNIVVFNLKVIIKIITILLLLYLIISLIKPLVKKVENGLNKETIMKIAEYIFIVIFFLFMIYDISKIL